jgi:hypothetical protein
VAPDVREQKAGARLDFFSYLILGKNPAEIKAEAAAPDHEPATERENTI